ncbi:MAG: hypothetical protein ACOX7R_13850 [Acetivibrionales bacterium]|jgi:hypothetical protein
MECFNCGNCKSGDIAYFCLMKNDFVLKKEMLVVEKTRTGWKKGHPNYENQRRKNRKEIEV